MNNENGPIIYDVLTYVKHPKYGGIYLNIEAQKGRVSYPLSNRIDVYLSNGICMQNYGKMEETYKELKPFVSIWLILNGTLKDQNSIRSYSPKEQMIYGNPGKKILNSKTKAVLVNLGREIDENNQLLALFETLFSMKLSYEEKIKKLNEIDSEFLDEEIEKEVNTMCNLGEAYREEFLNEGREEGEMNATFKNAILIVDKLHFDFKRALIILDITDPKEQDFYFKKYKSFKNNH